MKPRGLALVYATAWMKLIVTATSTIVPWLLGPSFVVGWAYAGVAVDLLCAAAFVVIASDEPRVAAPAYVGAVGVVLHPLAFATFGGLGVAGAIRFASIIWTTTIAAQWLCLVSVTRLRGHVTPPWMGVTFGFVLAVHLVTSSLLPLCAMHGRHDLIAMAALGYVTSITGTAIRLLELGLAYRARR
ncbi:MAG: hypothetical protein ABI321_08225 [Polyangia bacterium]